MNKMKQCPRCHLMTLREVEVQNALSRRDNDTYICSDCGTEEAFIDAGLMAATDNEYNFKMKLLIGVR